MSAEQHRLFTPSFLNGLMTQVKRQCVQTDMKQVASELAALFEQHGVPVSRLQLPLSTLFGFRHPFYMGIVSSWSSEEGATAMYIEHNKVTIDMVKKRLSMSPYGQLTLEQPYVYHSLKGQEALPYQILEDLRTEGYIEYVTLLIELPDGAKQVLSLALNKRHAKFNSNQDKRVYDEALIQALLEVRPALSLYLFGIYQQASMKQIAHTYLGQYTSQRVLEGDIYRGKASDLETFIVFADIRGFTALSEKLGARAISMVVSHAFDILVESFKELGGEVLKFIGDAALLIFPKYTVQHKNLPETQVETQAQNLTLADRLLEQVSKTIHLIEAVSVSDLLREYDPSQALAEDESLKLSMGFGIHYGCVSYGNIGAKERLDFTVMGSAVNLAARLESLTKELGVKALCSETVIQLLSQENDDLKQGRIQAQGDHELKGVSERTAVWSVH